MQTEKLHIRDLPDAIVDEVSDAIAQFTVGLQRVVVKGRLEDCELIGTGTLVYVGGFHAILTAEHVLAVLGPKQRLALLTSFEGRLRRHVFDPTHIQVHRIARGTDDSKGPDVGLIILPSNNIGNLSAEKSFFNLDKRVERFREGFVDRDRGFWFSIGVVGESEIELAPQSGFARIKGYQSLCGTSTQPREYEDSDYDYLEVRVDYEPENPELPRSFGGFSGGGIWHVPMRRAPDGRLEPEEYILSGLTFFQTAVENGVRLLRCHGRKTVYVKVPAYVEHQRGS